MNTERITDINDIRIRFLPVVIEKKLKGSLNQAEGEPMPEEPVKDDKKDEKKDKK